MAQGPSFPLLEVCASSARNLGPCPRCLRMYMPLADIHWDLKARAEISGTGQALSAIPIPKLVRQTYISPPPPVKYLQ